MKFPPRWWRRPRYAAPAPHWHRTPGRSATAAARTMCVQGGGSGAGTGARPAGGRCTHPDPRAPPTRRSSTARLPAASDRQPSLPPPFGWAVVTVNQTLRPARRGPAAGRSLGRWQRQGGCDVRSPGRSFAPACVPCCAGASAPFLLGAAVFSSSLFRAVSQIRDGPSSGALRTRPGGRYATNARGRRSLLSAWPSPGLQECFTRGGTERRRGFLGS